MADGTRGPFRADGRVTAQVRRQLRVPAWLGWLLAGEFVVAQMATSRVPQPEGQEGTRFVPRYPSWREGVRAWPADEVGAAKEYRPLA